MKQGIYEISAGETNVLADIMSAAAAMPGFDATGDRLTVPCIRMTVDASSGGNIKPTVVFEKFCSFAGCEIPPAAIQVTRLETYAILAKEDGSRQLVPLYEVENEKVLTFPLVEDLF